MLRARRDMGWALLAGALALGLGGCGGGSAANAGMNLVELNRAIREPVADPAASQTHSRLVEDVVDSRGLEGLGRVEVRARIGEGEPCRFHPRCLELGFDDDDWYYTVGVAADGFEGTLPLLIVGFDSSGSAARVWHLRVH